MARKSSINTVLFTFLVHSLGILLIVLLLLWQLHFRGGLAWSSNKKEQIFNIHPTFMIVGFVFLSSEAIIIYKSSSGPKLYKKTLHMVLNALALVAAAVGISAAFRYHNQIGIQNVYSLHSWLGLCTVSLFAIQWIIGFLTFWFPGASSSARARLLPWHVILGLLSYILAVATSEAGILEKLTFLETGKIIGRRSREAVLANFVGLSLLVFAIAVVVYTVQPASTNAVAEDSKFVDA